MSAIVLPRQGFATEEGTILRWLKQVGQTVAMDEPLLELTSEKAIQVLPAPEGGVLLAIYAPAGAIVLEGEPVGWIGAAGEPPPQLACRIVGWEPEVAPQPQGFRPARRPGETARPPALATQRPHGSLPREQREVLKHQLRPVTAQRMAASWRQSPKVDLFAEVDFTRVQAARRALKEHGQEPPSYNIYIAHAVARAFQDLPHLNRQWDEDRLVNLSEIHVGVAVALGEDLVTVSLKNLAGADVAEIQRRFKGLIRKAAGMNLSREELFGSSLTVTNLGEFDVTAFTAILNPPEIFILAIGKVEERPAVRDGRIVPVLQCTFCLSFDHRAVDGAPASRLLQRIKWHLEHFGIQG